MEITKDLSGPMKGHARRYRQLKENFEDMASHIDQVFNSENEKAFGIKIELQTDQEQFAARFGNLTVVASFSTYLSANDVLMGKVEFFKLARYPLKDALMVDTLTFDAQGMSNAKDPAQTDPFYTSTGGPYMLLQVLRNALATGAHS